MKLQIFKKTDLYDSGKDYLLDIENDNKPAQFDSVAQILNLFKSQFKAKAFACASKKVPII